MRQKRVRPMPTEEEKARARLKAESMDPLVWAMKSVDAAFPDSRGKNEEVFVDDELEDEPEEPMETARPIVAQGMEPRAAAIAAAAMTEPTQEIKAEGKLAMPADNGVLTMEVTPMRQDVSDVSPEEIRKPEEPKNEKKSRLFKKSKDKKEQSKKEESKKGQPKKGSLITKVKAFDSSQKKMMIAVGMMSVAAFAGIMFGVVSMVRQNETTKELTEQIVAAQNDAKTAVAQNTADGDYINLKDWSLRIKVVSGLTYVSYNYASDEYSEVMIWGAKRDTSANYSPEFVNQSKNASSMGTVVRVPRYERAAAGRLIWYDDYYNYYYQGPSGVPNVSEDEMSWWVDSYLLIKEMLTNADNYEKYEQNTIGQS